ncbi:MAG: DegQ family serine endoprotease [Xanthomonadaceae bacterium]|nr:DegQ family serine endoprotease [Xanthomonadaceae bacterium]
MKSSLRTLSLVAATAAATATATVVVPITARSPVVPPIAAQVAAEPGAAAPQLVTGLPDFTQLVDHVGPAVVSIIATGSARSPMMRGRGQQIPEDQFPEFFRRFFGPDAPIPGGPGGGRGQAPDDGDEDVGPQSASQGSGFVISADGYVLTNHHVVDGADKIRVRLADRREFDAKLVGSDEQSDVAVLKVSASGLPFLRTGDSKKLKPGQWVVAIGSPFGLEHSVTAGIVSAVGRSTGGEQQRYVPFIQTDVAINRGNSGGPLLNTRGEVVGINSQIFSNSGGYMGVSFAIPMDVAMNVTDQIKTRGKVERAQLGAVVGTVTAEAAKGFDLPDTRGALVTEVRPGSAAEKAGIEPGDVIRSVDGMQINDFSDLPPAIGSKAPGTSVKLAILRGGKPIERSVTLTRLDDGDGATSASGGGDNGKPAEASSGNKLGLIGQDLDADDRRSLNLRAGEGVGLARVEGRAARVAGLRSGDIILRVGTTPVGSVAALDRELAKFRKDQTVMLLIRRGGATAFVPVSPVEDSK